MSRYAVLSLFLAGCAAGVRGQAPAPVGGLGNAPQAGWQAQILGDTTPLVSYRGSKILDASYLGWGANWQFAGTNLRTGEATGEAVTLAGQTPNLKLTYAGTITRGRDQLVYDYLLTTAEKLEGVIGTCLEWHLRLGAPVLQNPGAPEILPDESGFRWPLGEGVGTLEVRFEPKPAACYFERGNKAICRTYFVQGEVPAGQRRFKLTLSLPAGTVHALPAAARYAPVESDNWSRNALPPDAAPVDLSFLNHRPAGKFGFVKADGDRFVLENGEPIRFWGGNIAAYTIFAEDAEIERHARRIAALGYNLMRIHHHDSTRWVSPTVIDKSAPDSRTLDQRALARLDKWLYELKQQGVYVWLDLHVGRVFKEGDVQSPFGTLEGFAEIARRGGEIKGYCYYNPTIEALLREFNEKYLNHVNPLTGLAYKDDPAIMGVLITNENDLTNHFGNLMLGDKNNPHHNAIFEKDYRAFAAAKGLPANQVGQTWVHGPSKIYLNDKEQQFNRRMIDHLTGLGVKVPIATTNYWGGGGIWTLPALTVGSVLDVHSYGGAESLDANPRYDGNWISTIAAAQVAGLPVSITEWNVPYPHVDRFVTPLYLAAIGSLQGWDAPMIYNYSQRPLRNPDRPDEWSTFLDPALTGIMAQAALAYRRGDIAPARETYYLKLNREQTYFQGLDDNRSATIRTLAEQSRLVIGLPDIPELDWDRPSPVPAGATIIEDPGRDFIPADRSYVVSDTGEITRDWVRGLQLIDTPRTQAAQGWLGGLELRLGDLTVALRTPKAVVAVSSLDERPIATAESLLVTALARATGSGGRLPMLTEPVVGTLTIRAPQGLVVEALAGDGSVAATLTPPYRDGRYTLTLTGREGTHWFRFRR